MANKALCFALLAVAIGLFAVLDLGDAEKKYAKGRLGKGFWLEKADRIKRSAGSLSFLTGFRRRRFAAANDRLVRKKRDVQYDDETNNILEQLKLN